MTINYDQLSEINKTLASFPNAKLQIVTKNRDFKLVKELIDKGYHLFGENKVQEAQDKFKNIIDPNLELHLIGPLQTNKAKLELKKVEQNTIFNAASIYFDLIYKFLLDNFCIVSLPFNKFSKYNFLNLFLEY